MLGRYRCLTTATGLIFGVFLSVTLEAQSITRLEALASAFTNAEVEAQRVFLTKNQIDRAAALVGGEPPPGLVVRYLAREDGVVVGRAYIETHLVRTKRESLLISLNASGIVRRIDVTAFLEPPEYIASDRWFNQYVGNPLSDDLDLYRSIRPIAGGTLTALAANGAIRRVLAIDHVLEADK